MKKSTYLLITVFILIINMFFTNKIDTIMICAFICIGTYYIVKQLEENKP